jgi:hypothetical protein
MRDDPRNLPQHRLLEIRTSLAEAGLSQIADELGNHIDYLEEELSTLQQYYEEFVIPGIEGRAIGAWSDRVVSKLRNGKPYIQDKSGKKTFVG